MYTSGQQAPNDTDGAEPARHRHAQHRGSNDDTGETVVEQMLVPPVIRQVTRVLRHDLAVPRLAHVVEHVAELHFPKALELRAVRIPFLVREGVMLAMHRDPLPGYETGS